MRRSALCAGVALAALAVLAEPGSSQTAAVGAERGWIGISVDIVTSVEGGRARTEVTVTGVNPGSPASAVGIRPGDRLLSMAGRSWERLIDAADWPVKPGDPVRLVLERDGVRREILLRAARRPAALPTTTQWSVTVRADSIVDQMYRAMDSLRIRLTREERTQVVVRSRESARIAVVGSVPDARSAVPRPVVANEVAPKLYGFPPFEGPDALWWRLPFTLHVLQGSLDDSLSREIDALGRQLGELRRQEAIRVQELAGRLSPGERRIDMSDPELRRLEAARTDLSRRRSEILRTLTQAPGEGDRARSRFAFEWSRATPEEPSAEPEGVVLRPLAPYLLGENRVAGAQIVDLRQELAEYFRVDAGVLVVDVPDGTPAAMAGLQPGDVITHADGAPVRSIKDLRLGLARAAAELPLSLVRKGTPMQVRLHR